MPLFALLEHSRHREGDGHHPKPWKLQGKREQGVRWGKDERQKVVIPQLTVALGCRARLGQNRGL